ncbi:hypothetical protein PO909_028125, partial [Leuciscus waleckii]
MFFKCISCFSSVFVLINVVYYSSFSLPLHFQCLDIFKNNLKGFIVYISLRHVKQMNRDTQTSLYYYRSPFVICIFLAFINKVF